MPSERSRLSLTKEASSVGPARSGRVAGLYTAAEAGAPMRSHASIEVVPGVGVVGDRYASDLRLGHWSAPEWPDQELTLFAAEVADELGLAPALLRRNVVVQGARLEEWAGVPFRLGSAELEGVRACDPCRYLETLLDRPGLRDALAGFRGGLRVRVVTAGRIGVGDVIEFA